MHARPWTPPTSPRSRTPCAPTASPGRPIRRTHGMPSTSSQSRPAPSACTCAGCHEWISARWRAPSWPARRRRMRGTQPHVPKPTSRSASSTSSKSRSAASSRMTRSTPSPWPARCASSSRSGSLASAASGAGSCSTPCGPACSACREGVATCPCANSCNRSRPAQRRTPGSKPSSAPTAPDPIAGGRPGCAVHPRWPRSVPASTSASAPASSSHRANSASPRRARCC